MGRQLSILVKSQAYLSRVGPLRHIDPARVLRKPRPVQLRVPARPRPTSFVSLAAHQGPSSSAGQVMRACMRGHLQTLLHMIPQHAAAQESLALASQALTLKYLP